MHGPSNLYDSFSLCGDGSCQKRGGNTSVGLTQINVHQLVPVPLIALHLNSKTLPPLLLPFTFVSFARLSEEIPALLLLLLR